MINSILLVDDDVRLRDLLTKFLSQQGFRLDGVGDSKGMQMRTAQHSYQLYILDVNLPGESGLEICKRLRQSNDTTPIIMLTARSEELDRIHGLELGADDYLPKPFNTRELLARIKAILRRTASPQNSIHDEQKIQCRFGEYLFDGEQGKLLHKNNPVILSANEFGLLKILILNRGHIVSRTDISQGLYSRDHEPNGRSIDVMISRLRKGLNQDSSGRQYIQSIRNKGYMFRADINAEFSE